MNNDGGLDAAQTLEQGLGRRGFLRAVAAISGGVGVAGAAAACSHGSGAGVSTASTSPVGVLQPGRGNVPGAHYLRSNPDEVLWGYVPTVHSTPVMRIKSGETVTIDSISHEGILEDQGRNPVEYFGSKGVAASDVLEDAIAVAAEYNRTPRSFDKDGPHVVTGPIFVQDARPGDVLKIETLEATPRVPYGVVSSRHGKGALGVTADRAAPAGISLDEVMPPIASDGRANGTPTEYGNVSTFTAIEDGHGVLPVGDKSKVRFPLRPFMGMMGVAFASDTDPTSPNANSIPPTLGGGNIDIRQLGIGSAFYLPVFADGALFYVGDPHMSMGDGEVSLTAMEGSLRGTFRLTVCKPGSGDAPSVAFHYPFAETDESWIPIGLSDPNGAVDGQISDLNVAMRRAVVNALDFLEHDRGMDRATAYAYLSAAADFTVSQVVDRTVGVHGLISKSHFV
ncbi:acetamidase/formamidase family protein [Nocardia sp. NBC_00881]|uniref:acetamidase/formamidase family protein n=1 Tax=Nocardia sp. NBC_00881 TaxID=2975995 RepID=UPI003866A466|nr:acetamidase/formamidase family protein [Nocardia sp. NBC_00881]